MEDSPGIELTSWNTHFLVEYIFIVSWKMFVCVCVCVGGGGGGGGVFK